MRPRLRAMKGTGIEIDVTLRVRCSPRNGPLLRRVASHAARAEGFRRGVLSIAVVGRRAMSTLHLRHMRVQGPTDVLTFDLGTDRKRRWIEGEIVVCRDVAASVCRSGYGAGISPRAIERELALYVTHGVLHLAGYDDHDPQDFRRIHTRENQILSQLSLGKAFGNIIE